MLSPELHLRLTENKNSPEKLLEILKVAGVDYSAKKIEPEAGQPYGRNVLVSIDGLEVMLAKWAHDFPCSPHNHGSSHGWVFYLEGEFKETIYDWSADGELKAIAENIHHANTHTKVVENVTHSCLAINENALSLHIYFPKIEAMKVHDIHSKRTLIVSNDCGAWIPTSQELIKEEIKWNPKSTL